MQITTYTTYAEVRSTVGMSEDTLPDSILGLELYANALELALDSLTITTAALNPIKTVFPTLDPVNNVADVTPYNLTRMFSTYTVALEVATSLSMRAPKTLSDSKVTLGRFSPEATWQDVIKAIKAKLKQIKDDLVDIGNTTEDEPLPYLTVASPATDPVTGS
jgi:hypothetical protein